MASDPEIEPALPMAAVELTEKQAFLVLNALPELGPVTLRRLTDAFGEDPRAILAAAPAALRRVEGVRRSAADAVTNWETHVSLEREEASLSKSGVTFVTRSEEAYPELLREIYDPPIGLYWKGEYRLDRPCIAMVGTRRTTLYGQETAKKLAAGLVRCGFCIVSGMARGIDTAAHRGALDAGGRTIAVLGSGLDIVYPPENLDLYREIAREGAVLSEFPFGRRADRQTFPMRNRIVAGMCVALIVVESGERGGAMITARFAAEQGRTVFAVPGRIDQAASRGCHRLLREGAVLVRSPEDVLEELPYLEMAGGGDTSATAPEDGEEGAGEAPSGPEGVILAALVGGEALHFDRLAERTDLASSELSAALMILELKKRIVKRADGCFEARG